MYRYSICSSARRFLAPATVLLTVILLCSCTDASREPNNSNSISIGLSGEPESLDGHKISSNQARSVLLDIGEGLIAYDESGALVPGVSSSWEVDDTGHRYLFQIRENARWSNGNPIVAEDFEYAFRKLFDPATAAPYAQFLSMIENAKEVLDAALPPDSLGVRALDARRLEIILDTPTPYFLELLAHPSTFPKLSGPVQDIEYGPFNGAYTLEEWIVGSELRLSRNPYYWNDASTSVDNIYYHVLNDDAQLTRFRTGQLQISSTIPEGEYARVLESYPNETRVSPLLGIYYYGFNLKHPPFQNNKELRQALSLAIDRNALVNKVIGRGEAAAYNWVPPGIGDYVSPEYEFKSMSQEERENEARRLFELAGYSPNDGLQIELRYNTIGGHEKIATAIQSMWKEVLGVEAVLRNEEFRVFISNVMQMDDTQIFRLSWTGDYKDPLAFLDLLTTSSPSNLTGYSNSEVDRLIKSAEQAFGESERNSLLAEAEAIAINEFPVIPLYFYVSKHLVSERVSGWQSNVLDVHLSKFLSIKE